MVAQEDAFGQSPEGGLSSIEQLQKLSEKVCTNENTPFMIGVNENDGTVLLTKASCKSWNCEPCAARNARTWIARILYGCNQLGEGWFFLTITANKYTRKQASVYNLRQGWKKLYNRILAILKKSNQTLYYVRVWEQHEDGSFHLHAITNLSLGTRWAKDNATATGMGFMAEWKKVRKNAGQVAAYVAKYSLKNANLARGGIKWPKDLRRVEVSRNWPKLPDIRDYNWQWIIKETEFEQQLWGKKYVAMGFEIVDITTKLKS